MVACDSGDETASRFKVSHQLHHLGRTTRCPSLL